SCKDRCNENYDSTNTCQCNDKCRSYGNCCDDFIPLCASEATCKGRCDETSKPSGAICSCDSECTKYKNCCDDYADICSGDELPWVEEPCATAAEMKCPAGFDKPPVILFSIDGFQAEYIYRSQTPNIWKLATCGVHAPYMRSVTPTSTFPNHYSMATGLYPESHGIVSNTMYDHDHQEKFNIGNPNDFHPFWWGGEPIWVTTSNQGLKSATYFWVGSDVNITRYPDYYYVFDGSVPNEERMYQALDWLDLPPQDRPSFIALYMDIVDHAGHSYGPNSPEVNTELAEADRIISILMNGLKLRGLQNCVNIIMVADHGMTEISCDRKTSVEDYGVNLDNVFFKSGAFSRVGKSSDRSKWDLFDAQQTYEDMRCKRDQTHWHAYLKHGYVPTRYHYTNNARIDDVIIAMDDQWISEGRKGSYTSCNGGTHGYDNEYRSMHALFAAHGPGFKRDYNTTVPFENIEIYNLVSELLDLTPAPNNGTTGSLNHVLITPKDIQAEITTEVPDTCPYPDYDIADICVRYVYHSATRSNKFLNISSAIHDANMPYGRPEVTETDTAAFCLLTQSDYVTAYDFTKNIPRYVSFTLQDIPRNLFTPTTCTRPDIRVPLVETTPCSDYSSPDVSPVFLYHPALSNYLAVYDATVTSNTVPMYKSTAEIWGYMSRVLADWSGKYGGINVIAGPAFDYNYDSLPDSQATILANGTFLNNDIISTPIPTHFFLVVSRCANVDQIQKCILSPSMLEVQSFIIPNFAESPCYTNTSDWIPKTVKEHVARIRDVELLTGISFLPTWTHSQNANQETRIEATRLRLRLPQFDSQW
uniref:SMB domain-containing protein n=1 Tax=Ciona savignyi TaxID=51511 RepID=H2YLL8_CIOSA